MNICQWPSFVTFGNNHEKKRQKDKQRSIKHTYKTKDSEIFQERFEDIKNEIRNRRSKKDRQHNG
jgi:hypothetical protein